MPQDYNVIDPENASSEITSDLQENLDAIRSNFEGDDFPSDPVIGQKFFHSTQNREYVCINDDPVVWVRSPANRSLTINSTQAMPAAPAPDIVLIDAGSASVTLTLRAIADYGSSEGPITFVRIDAEAGNAANLSRAGSDTIAGSTTYSLAYQYSAVTIAPIAGTSVWAIISEYVTAAP